MQPIAWHPGSCLQALGFSCAFAQSLEARFECQVEAEQSQTCGLQARSIASWTPIRWLMRSEMSSKPEHCMDMGEGNTHCRCAAICH
ncbi:hypothetical protein SynBIOSU31_02251 [Synechococcus sp. BIOS-U3-1]|nr:hypothetical protein SynBIOSU31_02251 [Synechococcus sp. BIOS-U3-1]